MRKSLTDLFVLLSGLVFTLAHIFEVLKKICVNHTVCISVSFQTDWTLKQKIQPIQHPCWRAIHSRTISGFSSKFQDSTSPGKVWTSWSTQVLKYFEDVQSCLKEEDYLVFRFKNKDRYPLLHAGALNVPSLPASSAPAKRAFSAGGHLITRTEQGSEMLSCLVFLKYNKGFLWHGKGHWGACAAGGLDTEAKFRMLLSHNCICLCAESL